MNILVMGLGFVGLTTALGFADAGFFVNGYDIDVVRAEKIAGGEVPFLEPGLAEALKRNSGSAFIPLEKIEDMSDETDVVFFCVGTPCDDAGKADISCLTAGIRSIKKKITKKTLLVIKSTVPPGTTQSVIYPYLRAEGITNAVAVNPEFLREGCCWKDFTEPDRIVCGVVDNDSDAERKLTELYKPFNSPIHFVSPNTAEFIKYLSNSLLANLISFSNEMAAIAQSAGDISVGEAFKILHEDNRLIGSGITHYIYPGCGYGGYCLPKDTTALIQNAKANGFDPKILREVVSLNEKMPSLTAEKIILKTKNRSDKIGILGLSFKPDSDDVRDSPAMKIISRLIKNGYKNIFAHDPKAIEPFRESYCFGIKYCETKEDVCENCDTIAVVTAWRDFYGIDRIYPDKNWVDCRYFLGASNG